jgi:hypothetical protein
MAAEKRQHEERNAIMVQVAGAAALAGCGFPEKPAIKAFFHKARGNPKYTGKGIAKYFTAQVETQRELLKHGSEESEAEPQVTPPLVMHVNAYLLKFALTDVSLPIVRVQVRSAPLQAPPQLANVFPAGGIAVKVTTVP